MVLSEGDKVLRRLCLDTAVTDTRTNIVLHSKMLHGRYWKDPSIPDARSFRSAHGSRRTAGMLIQLLRHITL